MPKDTVYNSIRTAKPRDAPEIVRDRLSLDFELAESEAILIRLLL